MNTKTCLVFSMRLVVVASLLLVSSCDLFEQDSLDQDKQVVFDKKDFYTVPGSSAIIDFNSLVSKSFINASLVITQQPQRGELIELGSLLYKYTPSKDFKEGQDQFLISVKSEGKIIKTETITISFSQTYAELPCSLIAVEDNVHTTPDSPVVVSFLENDRICGIEESLILSTIYAIPKNGEVVLDGESIIYTPYPAYQGIDSLIYRVSGTTNSGEVVTVYGSIMINVNVSQPPSTDPNPDPVETRPIFHEHELALNTICFVNDYTGFVGGKSGIFKTYDNGTNWLKLSDIPLVQGSTTYVHDLQFLNTDIGIVGYSICREDEFFNFDCMGGVMITVNGGQSWSLSEFDSPVTSALFVTSRIGFVATSKDIDLLGRAAYYKTTDGGSSWHLIDQNDNGGGYSLIQFVDEAIGYKSDFSRIYRSGDGGVSWNLQLANENGNERSTIVDMAAAQRADVVFAVLYNRTVDYLLSNSVFRSENGGGFYEVLSGTNVANIEFSPMGSFGLATGNTSFLITKDGGSSWQNFKQESGLNVPIAISIPSENVAYLLYEDRVVKYDR